MSIITQDDCLLVNNKVVFTGIPENIVISPAEADSVFVGASSPTPSARHVFTLGKFQGFRFVILYRYKLWWLNPKFGSSGSEVRAETQMLLAEVKEESGVLDETSGKTFYILVLPVLEGAFRASLQGNSANELQFCVESGDPDVQTSQISESVYIRHGENPYELIKNSIKFLAAHKGTFNHVENKKLPEHVDWFGWCTWDAFYKDVSPERIRQGLESFSEGGVVPRFLIIDEGWQDTYNEFEDDTENYPQFATRLNDIKENDKFGLLNSDEYTTLSEFIKFIKERYGIKYVYVWHALLGCWGGFLMWSEQMKKYNPKLVYPVQSPGNLANMSDIAVDSVEIHGIGLIDPEKISDFYNDYHSYLASVGVNGVKVDIQNLVETLASGYGGRVHLTAIYQKAVEDSVARNFKSNNMISSMSHNTDTIFSSQKSAMIRASEDFMPDNTTSQTLHIACVSFHSLLFGEISLPDWDMFQSKHESAHFHASARAVGGCPIYVSDQPGNQDFEMLKKLILPDGSILRAKHTGRPTRDCLFNDPVMDGKSLLKIWNLNKFTGIVGVFNCQGAGNWPLAPNPQDDWVTGWSVILSGAVSPQDVEFLEEVAGDKWQGDCAVYDFNSGSLSVIPKTGKLEVTLQTLTSELYTVSPVRVFDEAVQFAPIGLLDMFNCGGAVDALDSTTGPNGCILKVRGRGCGRFGAYSSTKPRYCTVDTKTNDFAYSPEDGLLIVKLGGGSELKDIELTY